MCGDWVAGRLPACPPAVAAPAPARTARRAAEVRDRSPTRPRVSGRGAPPQTAHSGGHWSESWAFGSLEEEGQVLERQWEVGALVDTLGSLVFMMVVK